MLERQLAWWREQLAALAEHAPDSRITFADRPHPAHDAYDPQHALFETLVCQLQLERTAHRAPLIRTVFLFLLNYPAMRRTLAGLEMEPYQLVEEHTKFDLTLAWREAGELLIGQVEYNADVFDGATIDRLARHYGTLAAAAFAAPERRVAELPSGRTPRR